MIDWNSDKCNRVLPMASRKLPSPVVLPEPSTFVQLPQPTVFPSSSTRITVLRSFCHGWMVFLMKTRDISRSMASLSSPVIWLTWVRRKSTGTSRLQRSTWSVLHQWSNGLKWSVITVWDFYAFLLTEILGNRYHWWRGRRCQQRGRRQ